MEASNTSQTELLKYLSGEISFETWLELQDKSVQQGVSGPSTPNANKYESEDVSFVGGNVFSSWGTAFTGGTQVPQSVENTNIIEESEDCDDDYEDEFYEPQGTYHCFFCFDSRSFYFCTVVLFL